MLRLLAAGTLAGAVVLSACGGGGTDAGDSGRVVGGGDTSDVDRFCIEADFYIWENPDGSAAAIRDHLARFEHLSDAARRYAERAITFVTADPLSNDELSNDEAKALREVVDAVSDYEQELEKMAPDGVKANLRAQRDLTEQYRSAFAETGWDPNRLSLVDTSSFDIVRDRLNQELQTWIDGNCGGAGSAGAGAATGAAPSGGIEGTFGGPDCDYRTLVLKLDGTYSGVFQTTPETGTYVVAGDSVTLFGGDGFAYAFRWDGSRLSEYDYGRRVCEQQSADLAVASPTAPAAPTALPVVSRATETATPTPSPTVVQPTLETASFFGQCDVGSAPTRLWGVYVEAPDGAYVQGGQVSVSVQSAEGLELAYGFPAQLASYYPSQGYLRWNVVTREISSMTLTIDEAPAPASLPGLMRRNPIEVSITDVEISPSGTIISVNAENMSPDTGSYIIDGFVVDQTAGVVSAFRGQAAVPAMGTTPATFYAQSNCPGIEGPVTVYAQIILNQTTGVEGAQRTDLVTFTKG